MATKGKAPTEPGFYWAQYNDNWTIVRVHGDFPFLRIDVFDIKEKDYRDDVNPSYVTEWGDKISEHK
jgi:hypothetical protein